MGKIEFTDGITNQGHAQKFLRGVDLLVKEQVVREVVATLREENGLSLRDLYEHGAYQDMRARSPICAHGTVRKIVRLYKVGTLQPYLDYVYPSVQEPSPSFGR